MVEISRMQLARRFILSESEPSTARSGSLGNLYLCTEVGRDVVYTVLLCCVNTRSSPVVSAPHKVK